VRLLTGVRPDVNGQGTSLDEALVADMLPGTLVWSLVRVYAEMALEVGFAIETL
jgi:hypothetical protein